MRRILGTMLVLAVFLAWAAPASAGSSDGTQRLCGWIENPTPANWWLTDRNGQWIISVQGDYEAEGMDKLPDFGKKNWIETNGHYGYGCACLRVETEENKHRIMNIEDVWVEAPDTCRADKHLKEPKP